MSTEERRVKDGVEDLVEQSRELVQQGNRRQVVVRSPDGEILLDVSMTAAALVLGVLLLIGPAGWLIMLAGVGAGIYKQVKIDFLREIKDEDETIMLNQ